MHKPHDLCLTVRVHISKNDLDDKAIEDYKSEFLTYCMKQRVYEMARLSMELRRLIVSLHQNGDSIAEILCSKVTVELRQLHSFVQADKEIQNCGRPQKSDNTSQAKSRTPAVLRKCFLGE